MKYVLLNLILIFCFSCKSSKTNNSITSKDSDLKKYEIAIDSVSKTEKKSAYEFAYQTFTNCDTFNFPELTDKNATERLVYLWTHKKNKVIETCEKYNAVYGKMNTLKLAEILGDNTDTKYFRYKAKFSKTDNTAEIRVFTNSNKKFSGIIIIPEWNDVYSEAPMKN